LLWKPFKEQWYRWLRLAEYSGVPSGYLDEKKFPFLKPLEENAAVITAEFERIRPTRYTIYHDPNLTDRDWRTYPLVFRGKRIDANCAECPETARIVEAIPGLNLAAFSLLDPHERFKEHRGNPLGTLRVHMGIHVPETCGFRVGNETRPWQNQRLFVFDETYLHEAWNDSDDVRVVLIVDFLPDPEHIALPYRAMMAAEKARYHMLRAWYRLNGREPRATPT